jgi:hypothetical protein
MADKEREKEKMVTYFYAPAKNLSQFSETSARE